MKINNKLMFVFINSLKNVTERKNKYSSIFKRIDQYAELVQ